MLSEATTGPFRSPSPVLRNPNGRKYPARFACSFPQEFSWHYFDIESTVKIGGILLGQYGKYDVYIYTLAVEARFYNSSWERTLFVEIQVSHHPPPSSLWAQNNYQIKPCLKSQVQNQLKNIMSTFKSHIVVHHSWTSWSHEVRSSLISGDVFPMAYVMILMFLIVTALLQGNPVATPL